MEVRTLAVIFAAVTWSWLTAAERGHQHVNIYRPEVGVVFEFQGPAVPSANYWYQSFVVDLPNFTEVVQHTLGSNRSSNAYVQKAVEDLREETARIHAAAKQRLNELPRQEAEKKRARRGAPLAFVGSLSKSLFGTATFEDLQRVAAKVNRLIVSGAKLTNSLVAHERHFESYMKTNNHRVDNLVRGLKDAFGTFDIMAHELDKYADHFRLELAAARNQSDSLYRLGMAATKAIRMLREIDAAIDQLSTGNLPAALLPYSELAYALETVASVQLKSGHHYGLLHRDPHYYYRHGDYVANLVDGQIWITLKVPVGIQNQYGLYRIRALALPAGQHSTRLSGLSDYALVTADRSLFQLVSMSDVVRCRGMIQPAGTKACPLVENARPTARSNTCEAALIRGDSGLVAERCKVDVHPDGFEPQLLHVADSQVLVVGQHNLTLHCDGQLRMDVPGCDFCTFSLPCHCTLEAADGHFVRSPATLNCSPLKHPTVLHVVNYHVLGEYMDQAVEAGAQGSWTDRVNVTAATARLHEDLNTVLQQDAGDVVRLNRLAQKARSLREATARTEQVYTATIPVLVGTNSTLFLLVAVFYALLAYAYWRRSRDLTSLQRQVNRQAELLRTRCTAQDRRLYHTSLVSDESASSASSQPASSTS